MIFRRCPVRNRPYIAAAGAAALAAGLASAAFGAERAAPRGPALPASGPGLCSAVPGSGLALPCARALQLAPMPGLPGRYLAQAAADAVEAKPRRRPAARPRRVGQPECKAWKYHGADRIPRPYDPDRYVLTEEYRRDPARPGREAAARLADRMFPTLIGDKVLRLLMLVNRVRERRGHTVMKLEPRLMLAARRHNLDIARHALMQHTGTDCSQLGDRVWEAGYTWTLVAENLAGGKETAEATLRQWTGSTRHLMQMTLTGMTEVGIAYDHNPDPPRHGIPIKHFWTMVMARPDPWRDRLWQTGPPECTGKECRKETNRNNDE